MTPFSFLISILCLFQAKLPQTRSCCNFIFFLLVRIALVFGPQRYFKISQPVRPNLTDCFGLKNIYFCGLEFSCVHAAPLFHLHSQRQKLPPLCSLALKTQSATKDGGGLSTGLDSLTFDAKFGVSSKLENDQH